MAAEANILTPGAISDILSNKKSENVNVQVLIYKRIKSHGIDLYRLIISDGSHSYSSTTLNSKHNKKVEDGEINENCILRVDRCSVNCQSSKTVIVLNEIEVIKDGASVGGMIGNPVSFKVAESQNINPYTKPEPDENKTDADAKPSTPKKTKQESSIAQHNKNVSSPSKKITPINALTPYQNRYTIKGRVSHKSNIKTYSNSRGAGKLFNFTLIDETGEIRCTCFNEQVDTFHDLIESGKIYQVSQCSIKNANRQYSAVNNDYELTANQESIFIPVENDANIPDVEFNFMKISRIADALPNTLVDVAGVILSCDELNRFTSKKGTELVKRYLEIADDSEYKIRVTLWGSDAENFSAEGVNAIACKGFRIGDFNGRNLGMVGGSQLICNPETSDIYTLIGWYSRMKDTVEFKDFQNTGNSNMTSGGYTKNYEKLTQAKDIREIEADQAKYTSIIATLNQIKYRENGLYKACQTCKKKLVVNDSEEYFCEKCEEIKTSFNWNMILSVQLMDCSNEVWATSFQDCSETLTNRTAIECGEAKEAGQSVDQMVQDNLFETFSLRLKTVIENYNEEMRPRTTIMACSKIDSIARGKKLIQDIMKMGVE